MIAALLLVLLAVALIVALAAAPRRAIVAVPAGIVTAVLLIEEVGMSPRGGLIAALVVALALALASAGRSAARAPATPANVRAWNRLAGSAGILTRGRITTLRRRYDLLVSRDDAIDPFSTFGELRIKLDRRVPELIDNYLDEAATAPALRRHALMTELLGEVERLIVRAEAVDPQALARNDRRTALKRHLKGDDQP